MPRNFNEICMECELNSFRRSGRFGSGFDYLDFDYHFKDKQHAFKNCSELALDQELVAATETSEWHICKYSLANYKLTCQRIYDREQEYCSQHNKQCQHPQCESRNEVNNEFYCPFHANKCKDCGVRKWVNNEGYCSEHQNKCLTCENRTSEKYCSQHTYACYVNKHYPPIFCSERIATSNPCYCAKHYQACKNFRCHNRVPYFKSICEACADTDLCLNDCGKRIPKYTIYCASCREQDELKDLVKNRTNIAGLIQEVARFKTWWAHENIATIITNHNNYYWVFLGVIDRKPNAYGKVENSEIFIYPTSHNENKWGIYPRKGHDYLFSAQKEARWLRDKLNGDNPILLIHPLANSYVSFSSIVCEPYVKDDWNVSQNDFKPLDIAWVKKSKAGVDYYHVGVYIENNNLIHIEGDVFDKKGVRKTNWDTFLKNGGPLHRYHPIIPFKHYEKIISQLVWAKDSEYREGSYNVKNRNCEHFANMAVLNINYSQQIKEKGHLLQNTEGLTRVSLSSIGVFNTIASIALAPVTGGASLLLTGASAVATGLMIDDTANNDDFNYLNNRKGTINIRNEKTEVESKLGKKSDWETRNYEKEYEAKIEQPVNIKDCVIM